MSEPPQYPPPEGEGEQQPPWQQPGGPPPADPYGAPPPPPPYGQQPPPYGGGPGGQGGQQPPPYGGGYGGQQPPPPYDPSQYGPAESGFGGPAAGLAGRWSRLGAGIIDLIIVSIVFGILSAPFTDWNRVFHPGTGDMVIVGTGYAGTIISYLVGLLYYGFMHGKWGQTLGKKLLRIRVVRAQDLGALSMSQAFGRSAIYWVLMELCCLALIDVAWILWDPRRQALHDKAVQSVVVKVNPGELDPYASR
ncbi:MAG: domain containing protein [Actinomycetia bacterium]|nr:domain containing protein [Actinomycetes bacterium]